MDDPLGSAPISGPSKTIGEKALSTRCRVQELGRWPLAVELHFGSSFHRCALLRNARVAQ